MLENKTILLTGGTGSFGQAFTEAVLKQNIKSLRIYSRGEFLQYGMQQTFKDERLRFFIGDVRDKERLSRAMTKCDIVVHAAALKQVPTCEYNPIEAVKTNINGSINVLESALDNGVEKVIAVSSDKAVAPVNLYGATKMCMEKLFVHANSYRGDSDIKFSCVRYGNVLGSRGSLVPLLLKQKLLGKVTITDERMTRFWFAVNEGAQFVIDCLERMKGGEIFVPKLQSRFVLDMVDIIAPECEREIIGIRPGEKLHEVLVAEEESRHTKEFDTYFVIEPELNFWEKTNEGKPVPEGFSYSSKGNNGS